jgi:hypothetical protein
MKVKEWSEHSETNVPLNPFLVKKCAECEEPLSWIFFATPMFKKSAEFGQ